MPLLAPPPPSPLFPAVPPAPGSQATPFGTVFVPGREYTFKVYRPAEHEMLLWIEGQEFNMARVRTDAGQLRLHVEYDHGTFYFLGELPLRYAKRRGFYSRVKTKKASAST